MEPAFQEWNPVIDWDDDEMEDVNVAVRTRKSCVIVYDEGVQEMRWNIAEGEQILVGRATGIGPLDRRLSRHQVECYCDFDDMVLVVTVLGRHPSLNSAFEPVRQGSSFEVHHLETFWLLNQQYPVYVFIESEPNQQHNFIPMVLDDSESEDSGIEVD